MQFCHVRVLDYTALQPRLLEVYGAGMNSKNEREADPEQTNDIDSTQKPFLLMQAFPAWYQECALFYP